MSFLRRSFSTLRSLLPFGGAQGTDVEFTDGSRLVLEPANISLQPDPGWGVMRTKLKQKDSDPQICSPTFMRREGQIYSLLMPASDLPLLEQAQAFLKKQNPVGLIVTELSAASGLKIIRATGTQLSPQGNYSAATVFHFVLNASNRLVAVYYLGVPGLSDDFARWFAATVKIEN